MKKITTLLLFILVSACATPKKTVSTTRPPKAIVEKAEKDLAPIEGERFVALEFELGESHLTQENKDLIQSLVKKIKKERRPLNAIKILTWADKEYPSKVEKVSVLDSMLAEERTKEIKKFMERKLDTPENIVVHNMAKRPSSWSKILKDDDYDLKESFEKSGLTSTELSDGSLSYTKASKAIIIIDYKK